MSYDQIAWLPLCGGLTAVGLVLSFLAFRRRGAGAGLRAAAWSLIPVAAYLTGALPALWQMGTAAVGFVTGLVFSPKVWAGVAVAGLSALLFLISGFLRGGRSRGRRSKPSTEPQPVAGPSATPPSATAPTQPNRPPLPRRTPTTAAAPPDEDLSDIEEILKRRGIS
ncbi:cellulose synthase [Sphaerisporangium album]|uniref:Cellulose synthase n=1 Tax=Sphaerisporangium album TaxID=509200 RepID=A0A367FH97_9ACTN|nr:cellulose synthase [Sphaerisporangium album]RCG29748.1 cellulose synthase [Sphaerisporangium album]